MNKENRSVKIVSISFNDEGRRIDNFLFTKLKDVPKSIIYRILRKGEVRVNKKRIKPNYKIIYGDKVRIPPIRINEKKQKQNCQYLQKKMTLIQNVIYEDRDILILNKPSGIAVHGGSGLSFGLIEAIREVRSNTNFLELAHRLDRETSGILLVAKTRLALRSLHEQLRTNKIYKKYLALVRGKWESHRTVVQVPLLKNILRNGERIVVVSQIGKSSETRFSVEEQYSFATLLKCRPITGRTHQIRVHAQYAGHPIAFDDRYGDREFDKKLSKTGLSRLFLHAAEIKFMHPITGKIVCISSPLDYFLDTCIKFLRE